MFANHNIILKILMHLFSALGVYFTCVHLMGEHNCQLMDFRTTIETSLWAFWWFE